jgi:type I restriction enzyme R subunit
LIVDYIDVGEGLKKAIRQYTKDAGVGREPVDTSGAALHVLLDTPDVVRKEFFHGFDDGGSGDPKRALALLRPAMEHIMQVNPEVDEKGRNLGVRSYLDVVAKLTTAQAPAGIRPEGITVREEIAFFQPASA